MTISRILVTGVRQWQEASSSTNFDECKAVLCVSWGDLKVPSYGE